jgi:multicomponent Na+:H+ antiporter subunit E
MNLLPMNVLIALAWAAAAGDFSTATLALGFAAGLVALWLFGEMQERRGDTYHRRVFAALGLALYFAYDLVKSCVQVALAVVIPSYLQRSRFVTMPLDVTSDLGIMLTANLITLTPGTLSVDVAEDRRSLLIHAMFADDPDGVVRGLKDGIERRVIAVTE